MTGKVLGYDKENDEGTISANDGIRYKFKKENFKDEVSPIKDMKVDFEITDGKKAIDIYIDISNNSFNSENIKSKITDIQNSKIINNGQENIDKALANGMQNKLGFILAIVTAFLLFLPIIEIPFLGTVSIMDDFWGKVSFILLLIMAALFFIGAKRQYVKILISITSIILFLLIYGVISDISQGSDMLNSFNGRKNSISVFSFLKIGVYLLVPILLLLINSGFKTNYKENK